MSTNKQKWDTALTDAIVANEGRVQPYDGMLKFLSENFDIRPKGEFDWLISECWDASKDREAFIWDAEPWTRGGYTPKTKKQWIEDNTGSHVSESEHEANAVISNGIAMEEHPGLKEGKDLENKNWNEAMLGIGLSGLM